MVNMWLSDNILAFLENWNIKFNKVYTTDLGLKFMIDENWTQSTFELKEDSDLKLSDNNYENISKLMNLDFGMVEFDYSQYKKGDTVYFMQDTQEVHEIQSVQYDPDNYYFLVFQEAKLLYPSKMHCHYLHPRQINYLKKKYNDEEIEIEFEDE